MDELQVTLARYETTKKSVSIAYLLWLTVGVFGAHRFYLKRYDSAIILFLLAFFDAAYDVSEDFKSLPLFLAVSAAVGIWVVVDGFRLIGMVEHYNRELFDSLHMAARPKFDEYWRPPPIDPAP